MCVKINRLWAQVLNSTCENTYSIRFAKTGGPDEDLPDLLQDGFHDVWFLSVLDVGFSLFPCLHLGSIPCHLEPFGINLRFILYNGCTKLVSYLITCGPRSIPVNFNNLRCFIIRDPDYLNPGIFESRCKTFWCCPNYLVLLGRHSQWNQCRWALLWVFPGFLCFL